MHKYGLPNPVMQEGSFPINDFDKLAVNMTSYSEVEEEIVNEDGKPENFPSEMDKNLAA